MDSGVAGEKNILAPSSQGASDNIQPGDIVLLKQNQAPRNGWTMTTFPSSNGKVRKVELRTSSQGVSKTYFPSISDVVMLLETEVTDKK